MSVSADANPFYGLHAAVTRTDHEGRPIKGWHPEEAMTLPQAVRAFTLDAAYAEHQEKTLGSLEAGKWADYRGGPRPVQGARIGHLEDPGAGNVGSR